MYVTCVTKSTLRVWPKNIHFVSTHQIMYIVVNFRPQHMYYNPAAEDMETAYI